MHRATSVQDPREGREKVRRPHVHKSREHTSAAAADWPETVPSLAARQGGMLKYRSPLTSKRSAPTAATASTEQSLCSVHSRAMPTLTRNAATLRECGSGLPLRAGPSSSKSECASTSRSYLCATTERKNLVNRSATPRVSPLPQRKSGKAALSSQAARAIKAARWATQSEPALTYGREVLAPTTPEAMSHRRHGSSAANRRSKMPSALSIPCDAKRRVDRDR